MYSETHNTTTAYQRFQRELEALEKLLENDLCLSLIKKRKMMAEGKKANIKVIHLHYPKPLYFRTMMHCNRVKKTATE